MPTLGLALIARDEEENLPHLLASVAGAFDQVGLLDTGSTDRTVEIFENWATAQQLPLGYKIDSFTWCDDFAAARNAADELLTTEWACWADCDDEIVGADQLRRVVADMPPLVRGVFADYHLTVATPQRLRLARRGVATWRGRLHESLVPHAEHRVQGGYGRVLSEVAYWRHRRPATREQSKQRNGRVLRRWMDEEPENPIPFGHLAAQELMHGDPMIGMRCFARCIALKEITVSMVMLLEAVQVISQIRATRGRGHFTAEQVGLVQWAYQAMGVRPDGALVGAAPLAAAAT